MTTAPLLAAAGAVTEGWAVTSAPLLAAAAAAAGVLGAWECLATARGARIADRVALALAPLARARHEGRAPSRSERRRLALVATGSLLAAGWLLGGPTLGALTALAGPGAALAVVRARRARYRDELRRGAAPTARALADAIGAGHSIRGALTEAAPSQTGAVGHELRRVAGELDLGEATEAALDRLRIRAASRPWDTLAAAILLQRDAGGDLPALLRDLAEALEAADRLERDARTATAQARFTAWLVVGLPAAAAALGELAAPGFLRGLVAAPLSATLTVTALLLQAAGVLAIHRIVRVRAE